MPKSAKRLCARCGKKPAHTFKSEWINLASPYCIECADIEAAEAEAEGSARRLASRIKTAGIPTHMAEWTIKTYPHRDQRGRAAYEAAKGWLTDFEAGGRHNLFLFGPVGTGKTGLAVSIVRYLCETGVKNEDGERAGIGAFFIVWRDWLADVRRSFDRPGEWMPTVRPWEAPVLALDDLGAERSTEWALEELAGLVQRRRDGDRPTIVTSNYSPADLHKRLGGDLTSDRILDRLLDGATVHEIAGKSRRKVAR